MKSAFILLVLQTFFMPGCSDKADLETARKEIISLLEQERKAHFDRNADLFISEFADSMISVNKGTVSVRSEEENKNRIGKYFGSVEFIKWDDMKPPVIKFSSDGSLAYAIIQKQVILSYPDSSGGILIDTTDYAWASIYRKQKGVWKVECNISTNR